VQRLGVKVLQHNKLHLYGGDFGKDGNDSVGRCVWIVKLRLLNPEAGQRQHGWR